MEPRIEDITSGFAASIVDSKVSNPAKSAAAPPAPAPCRRCVDDVAVELA